MTFDAATFVSLIAAAGFGTICSAIIGYFKDRKKTDSDTHKIDVDTKLAYLNAVIIRLDEEVKRVVADRDRVHKELMEEQDRSAKLRMRVRELEDEIDGVRMAARDTQRRCDELANRLADLVKDAQEK